jgi:hypothetical protein
LKQVIAQSDRPVYKFEPTEGSRETGLSHFKPVKRLSLIPGKQADPPGGQQAHLKD